jgi:hypothetical protein
MPKRLKKKSGDENQAAFASVARIIQMGEPETAQSFDDQFRAHMAKLGRMGGKISGAKRMEMPGEQRREIASKAARAMWAKRKAAKKR